MGNTLSQSTLTIGIKYDTEALNQLASQLEHIAELMDRIHGRHDNEVEKSVGFASRIFLIQQLLTQRR
ncbi:hypothetical protein [Xenorhabdus taiwanensis]|uniref:Uncharacterized protein n=1 Tax=Xenorhabdus taiwanensis TaxID=3085177 RepID=A0ABM8JVJ4_9GAMM|nr:hypothetical protein TCT1_16420 [Xenorhabdus sp. TCT-1]